jgi:hypothetical protein
MENLHHFTSATNLINSDLDLNITLNLSLANQNWPVQMPKGSTVLYLAVQAI